MISVNTVDKKLLRHFKELRRLMYGAAAVLKREYEEVQGKKLPVSPHTRPVLLLAVTDIGLVDDVSGCSVVVAKLLSQRAGLINCVHIVPDCIPVIINPAVA